MRAERWGPVITSQLASNSFGRVVPGGVAAAGAMQYAMLARGGVPAGQAASGMTASSLLVFGILLALPLLALPAVLFGAPVDPGLGRAALIGGVVFLLLCGAGAAAMLWDRPLLALGRAAQSARNRILRKRAQAPRPAQPPVARAQRGARGARPALVAGGPALSRPLGAGLPDPAGGADRGARQPAPVDRAARLLRRPVPRHAAADAGRPRLRRGGADRNARPGRRPRRRLGGRDARLPAGVVLAADPGRGSRGGPAPAPLRRGRGGAVSDARRRR